MSRGGYKLEYWLTVVSSNRNPAAVCSNGICAMIQESTCDVLSANVSNEKKGRKDLHFTSEIKWRAGDGTH